MVGTKLLFAVATVVAAQAFATQLACTVCVQTETGTVRGTLEGKVLAFKSIPYAAPPVGERRFMPPQPAPEWQGEFDATRFRSVCPQVRDPLESYTYQGRKVRLTEGGREDEIFENEDCLHLTVRTPAADNKKRPVMVFLHGGAFIVGSGANDFYAGHALVERDVVLVTPNYRLGALGYLELGGLDKSYKGSGNNGLRDQIAAIEWVKGNVAAFGGDPDNITVFGESAGSISTTALLASKAPERLFKRAIAQSGGVPLIHTKAVHTEIAHDYLNTAKVTSMDQLLGASTEDLLRWQVMTAKHSAHGDALFAPYSDDDVIIGHPNDVIASGNAKGISLMLGATQNEMNYWSLYDSKLRNLFIEETDQGPAQEIFPWYLRSFMGIKAFEGLDSQYASILGTDEKRTLRLAQNDDLAMIQSMTRLAEHHVVNNPNTYLYRFTWKISEPYLNGAPDLGAIHALELPFVFGHMDFFWVPGGPALQAKKRPEDVKLSQQMVGAWTNFARTGNPNGDGVPHWPQYNLDDRPTMVWSTDSKAISDFDGERRKIWAFFPFGMYPYGI